MNIREYKSSDLNDLERFLNELQDYVVKIDYLKRNKRADNFGEYFSEETLKEVAEKNGVIFVVEDEERMIGFIAGIISLPDDESKLSGTDLRDEGRITELYVEDDYRGKGVGKLLMEKLEEYFKVKGCGFIRVEVFEPNKDAHEFYKKMGYGDRNIDMLKLLS